MNIIKKFWIVFISFLPFGAGAVAPLVLGLAAGVGTLAGFSIYRTAAPVDILDAYKFFSSCWTCQMFSDVVSEMSTILPRVYHGIGAVITQFAIFLTCVYFAWHLVSSYINLKVPDGWDVTGKFGTHIIKLAFISCLLIIPLPRIITSVAIEPVFTIGLSVNHIMTDKNAFTECMVATTLMENVEQSSINNNSETIGAFSPKLRNSLSCEIANVHQLTALGMTMGWTMLNMAFNKKYMHKIMWSIPVFPNVPMFFIGLLILTTFFFALLPIPLYFLEIFVGLSLDLIMLPLMLLSWLFSEWKIFPSGGKTIRGIIDDVVKGSVGIAMSGVFLTFAMMFINAVLGRWNGMTRLQAAMEQNDSNILLDGLLMRNDSLITIVLIGIFLALFMTSIPALSKTLFNASISQKYYDTAKKDVNIMWGHLKKWYGFIKK